MEKLQALLNDAASYGMDLDDAEENEEGPSPRDFLSPQDAAELLAGEMPSSAFADVEEDAYAGDAPAPASDAVERQRRRLEEMARERDQAASRTRSLLDDVVPPRVEGGGDVSMEEEPLPAMGDGESAPQVRAPRTLLSRRDANDSESASYEADAYETAAREEREASARRLLAMSVSGDNTRWVGWEDMPQRLQEQRSGPEVQVARHSGHTHVTRPGGYWQAARFNRIERPSRARRPANFGRGSGEGTLDGPRGGINQHDRIGIDKASGWPGQLHREKRCRLGSHCDHELQITTDSYPALNTRDNVHLDIQPYVKGVTSYSPNRRFQNYQYRNMAQISYLTCENGARRCTSATVVTVGMHSFRPGDEFTFSGVLGADRAKLNNQKFVVETAGFMNFTTTAARRVDTFSQTPEFDVSSSFILKSRTPTTVNPDPPYGLHEWSYEEGDKIYFFVTFTEPIIVTGTPRIKLNTGSHFEAGSTDAYATFVGGGFGEKKTFWKNNERNPIKMPMEANNWYEDQYHIHDGGCTMGGFQRDTSAVSDCSMYTNGVCDCATYSGITHTVDAQVRTRRVHHFKKGDLVIIQGVTGRDAHLVNKQHTVREVSSTGTSGTTYGGAAATTGEGNNLINFEPPLDLSTAVFDSRLAVVGRANIGSECRSHGLREKDNHGPGYCTFSADTRYHLPTSDSTLLDHTRYGQQLPGQPGRFGIGNTGRGATFAVSAEEGGSVVTTRKEYQYNEERVEQYMDNVLAFEYIVQSEGAANAYVLYDQSETGLPSTANQQHLTNDLDYKDRSALELNGGTIKRACANVFQVRSLTCGTKAVVEVYGMHRLLPGDVIALEGIEDTSNTPANFHAINREHTVHALPIDAGTDINRLDWDKIWDKSPPYGSDTSKFQINLDTAGALCGTFSVSRTSSRVRRKRFVHGDGGTCKFVDAALKLPPPGDKMKGTFGYFQSLSYNKDIVVGRPYVTNVTSDNPNGKYGYNAGFGVRAGAVSSEGVPDVIDVKVSFSEPVVASCGKNNDKWTTPQQYPGLRYRVCTSIWLVLVTKDGASAGDPNEFSTTGTAGTAVFPTGYLYETGYDAPNVLNFRYLPRRLDSTARLQYQNEFSLKVGCAETDAGGVCTSLSHVRRRVDNKLAGLRLPPTSRDAGRCLTPTNADNEVMCTSTTAHHTYSLYGQKRLAVDAVF